MNHLLIDGKLIDLFQICFAFIDFNRRLLITIQFLLNPKSHCGISNKCNFITNFFVHYILILNALFLTNLEKSKSINSGYHLMKIIITGNRPFISFTEKHIGGKPLFTAQIGNLLVRAGIGVGNDPR